MSKIEVHVMDWHQINPQRYQLNIHIVFPTKSSQMEKLETRKIIKEHLEKLLNDTTQNRLLH